MWALKNLPQSKGTVYRQFLMVNRLIITFVTIIIISGKDCIGCAKTGSGKTGAFALPILHELAQELFGIFALVLTPTR